MFWSEGIGNWLFSSSRGVAHHGSVLEPSRAVEGEHAGARADVLARGDAGVEAAARELTDKRRAAHRRLGGPRRGGARVAAEVGRGRAVGRAELQAVDGDLAAGAEGRVAGVDEADHRRVVGERERHGADHVGHGHHERVAHGANADRARRRRPRRRRALSRAHSARRRGVREGKVEADNRQAVRDLRAGAVQHGAASANHRGCRNSKTGSTPEDKDRITN